MERKRDSLDMYDIQPQGMTTYLRYNGYHFNKSMTEWAASMMKKRNAATGKMEQIDPWEKEDVDELLKKHNIKLENNVGYDYVYICNMAVADFYKSSLETEQSLAKYIKDVVDDADQSDGFIFNRFYADCVRNGMPIPWSDLI